MMWVGDRTIHVSDRFFLGHQLNMRHFAPFTLGPRDQGTPFIILSCASIIDGMM
jgi:outer membrane protein assembly factor BamA